MNERLIFIGIALIFLGFIVIMIEFVQQGRVKSEWGVGGFIGIVPFGFASNPKILKFIMILSLFIAVLVLILFLRI